MELRQQVEQVWLRIHSWLQTNAPAVLSSLRSGASETDISLTEQVLGSKLTDDLRYSFQLHDGQTVDEYGGTLGLIDAQELLSLEGVVDCWKMWTEAAARGDFTSTTAQSDDAIRNEWWNSLWIPLTYGVHGSYCLDLSPTHRGVKGQIISVWRDDPHRRVVASSFVQWLDKYTSRLEAGEYVLSDDIGGLVPVDEA